MKKLIATLIKLTMLSGLVISFSVLADNTETADKPSPPNVPNSTKADDVNAVFVFNRVCYGQMPHIDGIITMSDKLGVVSACL